MLSQAKLCLIMLTLKVSKRLCAKAWGCIQTAIVPGYRTILDNALLTYTDFYLKKLHHRYKICKITSETLLSLKVLSKKRLTGLRRRVSACKPHLKKRNSAKRYKFDIPDMPAFHKCMTGKMSYLLMKSTEGYTLCREFGSRENLHHSASS